MRFILVPLLVSTSTLAAPYFPSELPNDTPLWKREPAVQSAYITGKNDPVAAIKQLQPLSDAGNVQARGQLANYVITGRGTKQDEGAGCIAARSAYRQGAVNASTGLIGCLILGVFQEPRPSQEAEAVRVATEAWEKYRYASALTYLGLMQQDGIGMNADPNAAERIYRMAVRYGDEPAAFFLAQLLDSGSVAKHSQAEITAIYRLAAIRMHGPSMMEMAKRLSLQKETMKEAAAWAALADSRHEPGAAQLLQEIKNTIAREGMKVDPEVITRLGAEAMVASYEPMKLP